MNKKIFLVLSLFAVLMIGCAYASDSSDSNVVEISGVNFTIPEGFTEDVSEAVVNESGSDDGYNYVTNSKSFEDDEHVILISVATYDESITDDIIKDIGEKTTINNVTGYLGDMGFLAIFSYLQDNNVVVITADDKDIIEEVLA